MPATLKVFRTPIGFYDAYVAAPSMKAALRAWGSEKNLFASGRAEIVEDEKLTKAPLAKPGEVIKVRRGTAAENIAALPRARPSRAAEAKREAAAPAPRRPSRAALDRAEKALEAAERKRGAELDAFDEQIRNLQEKRRAAARAHDAVIDGLIRSRDEKAGAYEAAMATWRDG